MTTELDSTGLGLPIRACGPRRWCGVWAFLTVVMEVKHDVLISVARPPSLWCWLDRQTGMRNLQLGER
jgi:hypothetical protein